jgi:hypothetical protein
MPSPFPGMDPHLEDRKFWRGVHTTMIVYIRDAIQPIVLPTYVAKVEVREYFTEEERSTVPDITITEHYLRESALEFAVPAGVAPSATTMAEAPPAPPLPPSPPPQSRSVDIPYRILVPIVPHREAYIEIVHRESREIVTVIEILSPSNKRKGEGRDLYHQKQREVLDSEANLVEIDLLGTGAHTVAVPADRLTALPPHRYRICVSRAADREIYEVYAMALSDRLPRVNIPLRDPDPDVMLDLPAVFGQCYDNGGYAFDIDYGKAPPVALSEEEAGWARGWLEGRVGEIGTQEEKR